MITDERIAHVRKNRRQILLWVTRRQPLSLTIGIIETLEVINFGFAWVFAWNSRSLAAVIIIDINIAKTDGVIAQREQRKLRVPLPLT